MSDAETEIRAWFDDWIRATTVGDYPLMRSLIADDAVLLVSGAGQMSPDDFAAAATAEDPNADYALDAEIQDIEVFGEQACMWTRFTLAVTPKAGGETSRMAGHSLSVLRRTGDGWQLIRDASSLWPNAS